MVSDSRLPAASVEPELAAYEIRPVRDYRREIAEMARRGFVVPGRGNLAPWPFRLPFDWRANPLRDRNWMFSLHAWRMLDPYLVRLVREPGHPRAVADVTDVIADWVRGNVRRPGRFSWYDMSTGLRALKLAFLDRAAGDERSAQAPLLADLVERHVAELSRPGRLSPGNHGLFQMHGLMALAWQFPARPWAAAAEAYALATMADLLDRQLGPQGVHTEDAPAYHFFALSVISRILAAPWWQRPELAPFQTRLAAAEHAKLWLVDPAGRCLPVGDSDGGVKLRSVERLARWPHRRQGRILGAVVGGYGAVRSAPDVPLERSAMLFLTASHHLEAHKHADCLSLIWQERGEPLLVDSGKYGYERDRMRRYFQSTRAHSTVEVDHRDFSRATVDAYGVGLRRVEPLGAAWILEAEADHRREGILHRRLLLYRPDRFLLALDHLSPRPASGWHARLPRLGRRHFTNWWHFAPGLAVEAAGGGHRVTGLAGGRTLAVTHLANGTDLVPLVMWGRRGRCPQGWVSQSYGTFEPATALGFGCRAGDGYFAATLFEILETGAAPSIALGGSPEQRVSLGLADPRSGSEHLVSGGFALDIAPGLL